MLARIGSDERSNAGLARLVLVCVVAVATLVVVMRTGREEALVVAGKQESGMESRVAVEGIGEMDEPKGSFENQICAKRVFDEWKSINEDAKAAKLSWMKKRGSVLKEATVYDVDGSGQKRAVLMNDFDGFGGRGFGRGKYRVQTSSRNGNQFLMVWSDNTVARVESSGCRVTDIYLGTKNGGLDGRIAGDVGVKSDNCGRTAICKRNGFSGTCKGEHDCPNYFTLERHEKCSYNGVCIECFCGHQICNCQSCVGTNCPTHFDANCPPRGGSPCATLDPIIASSADKEGEAVAFFAGLVSAASAVLPPHLAAPVAIVAYVVGEEAESNALDKRFDDLTGAMNRAITELYTCMKVTVAQEIAKLATGHLITVRDKMIPQSMRGQSAAARERDDHWDSAKTACDSLGGLYLNHMTTSDWNKAASLLPTTVEAAELCALLFASMASDLVALGDTSDSTFRNLKTDFQRMMTRTLDASKRWISTIETALYTHALCGRFPDLRALVPGVITGYKRDFFSPVGAVGGPLILTVSEKRLFQCESSTATYLYMGGMKRWIPNESTYGNLFGVNRYDKITKFPDYVCAGIPDGTPITNGAKLILCAGYPHAMLYSNGEKRWLCGDSFVKYQFDWGRLVTMPLSQCRNICTGATICETDAYKTSHYFTQLKDHLGSQCHLIPRLLRCSSSPKAYLYIPNKKHWIPTWATYVRLFSSDTSKMVVLPDDQCANIPTGVTLTAGARLIQCSGYGHVLLESNGKKYWLCSLSTLNKYKFVINPVQISLAQCKALCTGPTICDSAINIYYLNQLHSELTTTTCT